MQTQSVLVVGDIMLDRFVYGHVDRISPESPVPVLSVSRENIMLGGAGNTLSNLVGLGCDAHIISVIGNDDDGAALKDLVEKHDTGSDSLISCEGRKTIVKTRFLAGHQQLLRTDYEKNDCISKAEEQQILEKAEAFLKMAKVMVLSDYGKGLLTEYLIQSLIKKAKKYDVTVLVDPKGQDYSKYRGADIVTPNKKELSESTTGMAVETDDQVIKAAQTLMESAGIGAVVATRSKDGLTVVDKSGVHHIKSAANIEVFDVSGAGDAVIATLAASLAAGGSLKDAAELANIAGSIVVSKVGTAPIRHRELTEVFHGEGPQRKTRQADVLDWDAAKEEISRWKARGLKVGFTNGCFDIVHLGHVTYLNDARDHCDRLVIGLNNDMSVYLLKGEGRPVHNAESRSAVLAAMSAVDMVVFFGAGKKGDDNTANDLLELLQPDIYFKGGDYTIDQIPEAKIIKKHGGVVKVMPEYKGHSTTASVQKIKVG
ncbi:MAG: D-glycero-beta-D-manno-heptose-7-phosphate kinase [Alphaproteobacteria bacterium]|nr:D-glycero-beta-D-manno-heptose-7-phosphate kinase [Alphaproteobacteria bacterium]